MLSASCLRTRFVCSRVSNLFVRATNRSVSFNFQLLISAAMLCPASSSLRLRISIFSRPVAVRVVNAREGTAARVRVVIESRDRGSVWGTVGVSENIIEASWLALVDSFEYKLFKDEENRV